MTESGGSGRSLPLCRVRDWWFVFVVYVVVGRVRLVKDKRSDERSGTSAAGRCKTKAVRIWREA